MKKEHENRSQEYVAGMSEAELRQKYNVDSVIKMGSNESPLGPSPAALDAIDSAKPRLHQYPPLSDDALRKTIADFIGHGISPAHVATGNGGCEILSLISYAFLGKDTECVVCRPTFPVYEFAARRAGAEVVYADLSDEQYLYDPQAILRVTGEKTRIVFLCSPNNPTGTLLPAVDFETIVQNLPREVVVVLDEVYHHFITSKDRIDPLPHILRGSNVIALHSFSKAYGLAGSRLGYVIGPPELIALVHKQRNPFHLNEMTIAAGTAAMGDKRHLNKTIELVTGGRVWLADQLKKIRAEVWPSEGNFLLFRTNKPGPAIVDLLLRQGVIIRPLENFGMPDFLRVTIGTHAENARLIDSLKTVLAQL